VSATVTSICSAGCGLPAGLPGAAIESSDTPSVQTVDAEDNDVFEFDDERLDAMGAKTAKAFTAAVRQHLERDRDRLKPIAPPGC
jgi:hypothetical protein